MPKHEEARISIILPSLLEDDQDIDCLISKTVYKLEGKSYIYKIDEDLKQSTILISDRQLTEEKVCEYFEQIMRYHQAIDEDLSEEELIIRDNEVKEKWLNGNFNYWLLDEPVIEL